MKTIFFFCSFLRFCLLLCCLHLNNVMSVMHSDVKKLLLQCFLLLLCCKTFWWHSITVLWWRTRDIKKLFVVQICVTHWNFVIEKYGRSANNLIIWNFSNSNFYALFPKLMSSSSLLCWLYYYYMDTKWNVFITHTIGIILQLVLNFHIKIKNLLNKPTYTGVSIP